MSVAVSLAPQLEESVVMDEGLTPQAVRVKLDSLREMAYAHVGCGDGEAWGQIASALDIALAVINETECMIPESWIHFDEVMKTEFYGEEMPPRYVPE